MKKKTYLGKQQYTLVRNDPTIQSAGQLPDGGQAGSFAEGIPAL